MFCAGFVIAIINGGPRQHGLDDLSRSMPVTLILDNLRLVMNHGES